MASGAHQQGALIQADFVDNVGGINVTDSPFKVSDNECLESYNFDYISTGGIRKRQGIIKENGSAYAVTQALGLNMYVDSNGNKTIMRASSSVLSSIDPNTYAATNLTEDTVSAGSTPFSSTTQPVVFNQFNSNNPDTLNGTGNTMWMAGGGLTNLIGSYSTTKYTANGCPVATGTLSAVSAGGAGSSLNGSYFYGVALYKAGTQVTSNVALDTSATMASGANCAITLSSITAYDTTKFTQIWLYRSAVSGVTGFTTGDLIAKINYNGSVYTLASGSGSILGAVYTDDGSSIASTLNIPRVANTIIDQGVLPTGAYNSLTIWKSRLVTATGSNVYLSELNKPEAWPSTNVITVPSPGPITGLAIIYFSSPSTSSNDSYLAVFKERELWVITGEAVLSTTSNPNTAWKLKFVDNVGCPAQSLITPINGFLAWVDYRGIYLWDGQSKPVYTSRKLETIFQDNGDLNKARLIYGRGVYYRKYNQLIWFLSSNIYGNNLFAIRMDLRLTLPLLAGNSGNGIAPNQIDGVFTWDYIATGVTGGIYAAYTGILPQINDEQLIVGDDTGYTYQMYSGYADVSSGPQFSYSTRFIDFGTPGVTKRIHKVIVYVQDLGNYNLTLNYWAGYRSAVSNQSSKQTLISSNNNNSDTGLWDVGLWDVAFWDSYTPTTKSIVFNLSSELNNAEGDCIKLQFQQTSANQPVTIYGYSILYTNLGTRK